MVCRHRSAHAARRRQSLHSVPQPSTITGCTRARTELAAAAATHCGHREDQLGKEAGLKPIVRKCSRLLHQRMGDVPVVDCCLAFATQTLQSLGQLAAIPNLQVPAVDPHLHTFPDQLTGQQSLLALRLHVQHERQSRSSETRVPSLKGLSYENRNQTSRLLLEHPPADDKLRFPTAAGLIIDQTTSRGS